jgi:hypothetical protein
VHAVSSRLATFLRQYFHSADAEMGVLGVLDGDYTKVTTEIMSIPGVVSVGLLENVVTDVAICAGESTQFFSKEQLLEAAGVSGHEQL